MGKVKANVGSKGLKCKESVSSEVEAAATLHLAGRVLGTNTEAPCHPALTRPAQRTVASYFLGGEVAPEKSAVVWDAPPQNPHSPHQRTQSQGQHTRKGGLAASAATLLQGVLQGKFF